jgi:vanillate/3-O-methylgallate O-demethylase
MTAENLEQKIRRIGNPVTMMRNSPQGHYEFPIPSEFSNWGDEQAAWRNTAVLFDQSFHMTDVYFRGAKTEGVLRGHRDEQLRHLRAGQG